MASISAVLLPAKMLKGGKHKIRISIAHNGETRYIVTNIAVDSVKEFKNGLVIRRPDAAMLNTKIRGLLQRYQDAIDELEYVNGLTCPELVYLIKNGVDNRNRTLQSVFEECISMSSSAKSTQETRKSNWNAIASSINTSMLVKSVTHLTILKADAGLRKRNLKPPTIALYMALLRMVINFAIKCGYAEFKNHPFLGYKFPIGEPRQSWLSVEEIKAIRDVSLPNKFMRLCRDIFMLSYYLGGINAVDLIEIDFNENQSTLKYVRQKTAKVPKLNKFVEFQMPDEAKEIIARLKGKDGRIKLTPFQRRDKLGALFFRNIPRLAKASGIKGDMVFYSARKSFSQHAFNLGVSTSVIDYILGHKVDRGGTSLYSYIKVTPEMATNAIRKVLDNLK